MGDERNFTALLNPRGSFGIISRWYTFWCRVQASYFGQGTFNQIEKIAESAKDAADDVLNYPQK